MSDLIYFPEVAAFKGDKGEQGEKWDPWVPGDWYVPYAGAIDDLRMWNHNVSAKEVSGATGRFGDINNYIAIDASGHMTLNWAATVFDDLTGDITRTQTWGTRVTIFNAEACIVYLASAILTDYALFAYQMSHKWKAGTAIYPHIHREQAEVTTPNWMFQYRRQRQGTTKTTVWSNYKSNTNAFTYTSWTLNQISYWAWITPPTWYSMSDIIQVRAIRDSNNSSWLFAWADTYGSSAYVTAVDIHFEADTLWSNTEYTK